MKYTFNPFLIVPPLPAEPLAPAGVEFAPELPLELLLLLVELQAARMPPASTAVSAAEPTRRAVRIPVMVVPFLRWIEQGGRDGRAEGMRQSGRGTVRRLTRSRTRRSA